MKASELRIGNWISNNGKPFQVYAETFCDIESTHLNPDPIPLTEEWLLKAGFTETRTKGYSQNHFENSYFMIERAFIGDRWNFRKRISESESISIRYITHLHELQNLIFVMSGEELTIKETL